MAEVILQCRMAQIWETYVAGTNRKFVDPMFLLDVGQEMHERIAGTGVERL
jgi:hypothetical protein